MPKFVTEAQLQEWAKGPPLDAWDNSILRALEKAERMAKLYNMPCVITGGVGRELLVDVQLANLAGRHVTILETVYPPDQGNV